MKKLNKKGFTLTEMIVVIAIIGILAGVLIPTITGYIQRARFSNDQQLAASMTDELERYCIDNNISQKKLCGIDVRTVLEGKEYDLEPSNKKWSYFYNEATKAVEVIYFDELTSQTSGAYDDITEVVKGHYLIGQGKNDIELLVSELVKGNYQYYQDNSTLADGYDDYADMLDAKYTYEKTLYIGKNSVLNGSLTSTYSNIVFCESVNYIPDLTINKELLEDGYTVENANFLFAIEGTGNLFEIVGTRGVKKLVLTTLNSNVEVSTNSTEITNFEQKIKLNSQSTDTEVYQAGGYLTRNEISSLVFTIGSDINNSTSQVISYECVDNLRGFWKISVLFIGPEGAVAYREICFENN